MWEENRGTEKEFVIHLVPYYKHIYKVVPKKRALTGSSYKKPAGISIFPLLCFFLSSS
jgi:hypothetical protein